MRKGIITKEELLEEVRVLDEERQGGKWERVRAGTKIPPPFSVDRRPLRLKWCHLVAHGDTLV